MRLYVSVVLEHYEEQAYHKDRPGSCTTINMKDIPVRYVTTSPNGVATGVSNSTFTSGTAGCYSITNRKEGYVRMWITNFQWTDEQAYELLISAVAGTFGKFSSCHAANTEQTD